MDVAACVAGALETAHKAGLTHRDIKPSNIIVTWSNGKATVVDLGITKSSDARHDISTTGVCSALRPAWRPRRDPAPSTTGPTSTRSDACSTSWSLGGGPSMELPGAWCTSTSTRSRHRCTRRVRTPPWSWRGSSASSVQGPRTAAGEWRGLGRPQKDSRPSLLEPQPSRGFDLSSEVVASHAEAADGAIIPRASQRMRPARRAPPGTTGVRHGSAPRARERAESSTNSTPTRSASPPASRTDSRSGSVKWAAPANTAVPPETCTSPCTSTTDPPHGIRPRSDGFVPFVGNPSPTSLGRRYTRRLGRRSAVPA